MSLGLKVRGNTTCLLRDFFPFLVSMGQKVEGKLIVVVTFPYPIKKKKVWDLDKLLKAMEIGKWE